MTIKDLIEKLSKYPLDSEVGLSDSMTELDLNVYAKGEDGIGESGLFVVVKFNPVIGDRVRLPKGTSVIVGNNEAETKHDTLALIIDQYDGNSMLTVDDHTALPDLMLRWGAREGWPENKVEIRTEYLKSP